MLKCVVNGSLHGQGFTAADLLLVAKVRVVSGEEEYPVSVPGADQNSDVAGPVAASKRSAALVYSDPHPQALRSRLAGSWKSCVSVFPHLSTPLSSATGTLQVPLPSVSLPYLI